MLKDFWRVRVSLFLEQRRTLKVLTLLFLHNVGWGIWNVKIGTGSCLESQWDIIKWRALWIRSHGCPSCCCSDGWISNLASQNSGRISIISFRCPTTAIIHTRSFSSWWFHNFSFPNGLYVSSSTLRKFEPFGNIGEVYIHIFFSHDANACSSIVLAVDSATWCYFLSSSFWLLWLRCRLYVYRAGKIFGASMASKEAEQKWLLWLVIICFSLFYFFFLLGMRMIYLQEQPLYIRRCIINQICLFIIGGQELRL